MGGDSRLDGGTAKGRDSGLHSWDARGQSSGFSQLGSQPQQLSQQDLMLLMGDEPIRRPSCNSTRLPGLQNNEMIFLIEAQIRNYDLTRTVHCIARHPHRSLSTTCHYENGPKLLSRRKRLLREIIRVTPGRRIMERHVVATLHHGQNPGVMIPDEMLKVPFDPISFRSFPSSVAISFGIRIFIGQSVVLKSPRRWQRVSRLIFRPMARLLLGSLLAHSLQMLRGWRGEIQCGVSET